MIKEFEGFLLRKLKYSDNTFILNIYSRKEGLLALLYRIKKKDNLLYLIPLTKIEGTFYYKQKNDIFNIKNIFFDVKNEIQLSSYEKTILQQIVAAIFYNICLYPAKDFNLYELLYKTYQLIHTKQYSEIKYLHIWILKELIKIMGFSPINNYSNENLFFNIETGQFVKNKDSDLIVDHELSWFLSTILNIEIENLNNIKINQNFEIKIINFFEKYFIFHLHKNISFKNVKDYLKLIEPIEKN